MGRPKEPGAAATNPAPADGYTSAGDLPAFQKLKQSRDALKPLFALNPSLIPEFERQSQTIDDMIRSVDDFYRLVGERHWIFHESLKLKELQPVIESGDADALEAAVIAHYDDPDWMKFTLRRTWRFKSMRARDELLNHAVDDYWAGRYYSTVLVLIAAMDGFVNDVEFARRGLHTRDEDEMVAWNSVVGHHLGLRNAHRTFTKSFAKTSDEPVHELYRNGIVHGNLTNFNNKIVAAKAWNRLFSVFDWADSLEAGKMPEEKPPSLSDLGAQLLATHELKTHNAKWSPRRRDIASDSSTIDEPVVQAASELFTAWSDRNFGKLSTLIKPYGKGLSIKARAGEARDAFDPYRLDRFEITGMRSEGPAVSHVTAILTVNSEVFQSDSRWLHETSRGELRAETQSGASWRTIHPHPAALAPGARPQPLLQ